MRFIRLLVNLAIQFSFQAFSFCTFKALFWRKNKMENKAAACVTIHAETKTSLFARVNVNLRT